MSISHVRFLGDNFERQKNSTPNQKALNRGLRPLKSDLVSFKRNVEQEAVNEKPVLPILHKLFSALPKTELHLHLSGSTPVSVIRDIMREMGMPEREIREETDFNPNFEGLDDFLKTYYKVAWVVKTPEHFKKAAYQICMDAAKENVKYLEIRTSCIGKEGNPDHILQAVTDGIRMAKSELSAKDFDQKAKIIVLAQRHHGLEESMAHAKIAEKWSKMPDSLVVGFDLAGPEDGFPIVFHEEAIKYAKNAGLKVTLHAGETPGSHYKPTDKLESIFGSKPVDMEPVESIRKAIEYGTDRLGHGVHLYDDPEVLKMVVDNQIPIESPPKCNVQLGSVKSYKDHPIKKMLDDNVLVSLSTDNRTISCTDLTSEYEELYKHDVINSWSDIKKLVINGAKSVFLPQQEKQELIKDFEADLAKLERTPAYKDAIDKYLTPARMAVSFVGLKLSAMFNNKAA
ncbi:MAG: adenosine deaminase [Vampirovibrionia bacterium]